METKDKLRLLYDISFSYNTIKDFVENNSLLSIDEFDNVIFNKTYLMINKNNSKCFVLIVDGGELLNKCK